MDNKAECSNHPTTKENLKLIKYGIKNGDLVWQANALNSFWEIVDQNF